MAKHKVADVTEISSSGSRKLIELEGKEIAIFNVSGNYYAVANYCIHQGGPLCEGKLRGQFEMGDNPLDWRFNDETKNICCPWHGWNFDVATGRSLMDERYQIPTYEVEVDGDEIFVRL